MSLAHFQKKYIQKNFKKKSIVQISSALGLESGLVEKYLKRLKGDKLNKILRPESQEDSNLNQQFSLKKFLKNKLIFFIILTALVLATYLNSLNNNFVSDDNAIVQGATSWNTDFVLSQFLSISTVLPRLLIYKLFGLNPLFFHLLSIFFHLGSVWIVYVLLSQIFFPLAGFFAASIFAVHPILTESVTWISGLSYVEYSFFFLLSFLTYILSKINKDKKIYFFSLFAFGLSLLSSEKAAVLFLPFFLFEISFGEIKKNWRKIFPYFILSIIFIIFAFVKLNQRVAVLQTDYYQARSGIENPLVQIPVAITSYLELIFWPNNLTLYHSEMNFSQLNYAIRLFILIILFIFALYSLKKNKYIFFWFSFFVITLLPTLTPLKVSWIVAERYVYLGALGIFAIVAKGFERLTKIKSFKMIIFILFYILIIVLSIITIIRNIDWKNEDNLWIATGKTSPSSPNTHNNLGDVYGRRGDFNNAVLEFKKAIAIKPDYADAYHNLGNTYKAMGKIEDAIKNYQFALKFNPKLWLSYQNLAVIYFGQKQYKLSLENMQKAIAINPQNINLQAELGVIYVQLGEKNIAKEIFTKVLLEDKNNQIAKAGLEELQKIK